MLKLIALRLAAATPNLLGVIVITFILTRALPGDPAAYFAGAAATPEAVEEVRKALGLAGSERRTPVVPARPPRVAARAAGHARWVSGHLVPWTVRRIQGASSGDGIVAKHPQWVRVD